MDVARALVKGGGYQEVVANLKARKIQIFPPVLASGGPFRNLCLVMQIRNASARAKSGGQKCDSVN